MTLPLPYKTLYNLTNTIFDFFKDGESTEVIDLLREILLILDIQVDFKNKSISYQLDADEFIHINYSDSKKLYPYKYKSTPHILDENDLKNMEDLLQKRNYEISSKMSVIFDSIGYILIYREMRWIIRR